MAALRYAVKLLLVVFGVPLVISLGTSGFFWVFLGGIMAAATGDFGHFSDATLLAALRVVAFALWLLAHIFCAGMFFASWR